MKVLFYSPITNNPYGGGNQFLRALRDYFISQGIYTNNTSEADVILVNSKELPFPEELEKWKEQGKRIVHRVDGVFQLYRNSNYKYLDDEVHKFAMYAADGVIFQSRWSYNAHVNYGFVTDAIADLAIIPNAAGPEFRPLVEQESHRRLDDKVYIFACSWSDNTKKGFKYLSYLDTHLDFSRFNLTFVGRSPVEFNHIVHVPPMSTKDIADYMRRTDFFFTGSEFETCSNSVLEAMASGLPVVSLYSGANPEIIEDGGLFFSDEYSLIDKIEGMGFLYKDIAEKLPKIVVSIETIGKQYLEFMERICTK